MFCFASFANKLITKTIKLLCSGKTSVFLPCLFALTVLSVNLTSRRANHDSYITSEYEISTVCLVWTAMSVQLLC